MKEEDTTNNRNLPDDRTFVIADGDAIPAAPSRKASLVVLAGWEIGREVELSGPQHVLGRANTADTRINSQSVSREHARIVRVRGEGEEQFMLIDLKSSNGTRVNNQLIESVNLANGDKIQMGDVLFRFVVGDETDQRFYHNIHRLIHYDQLTGLMEMDSFRSNLESEMQRSRPDGILSVAMTDLDGLKRVNDTYGHLAGRMVVREMGTMMRASLRPQDLPALYGGDEAVVLMPDTHIEQAAEVAEVLRRCVESHVFQYHDQKFQVSISQGLSEWPKHGTTVEQIIASADHALYTAKADGRNCVRLAQL